MNDSIYFSIFITTKDRRSELEVTLNKIGYLLNRKDTECLICDDGSTDGTQQWLKENYPDIKVFVNEKSKGLIYSRNLLLSQVKGEIAISLDDDLHFISNDPLDIIKDYFAKNQQVSVIGFRIFWGTETPESVHTNMLPKRVQSFAGGAHAWRMKSWHETNGFPDWFVFYGEEDHASYQLFKLGHEVHFLPQILVHHRVNLKSRRKQKDNTVRLRRSLRAGWYLIILFYPFRLIFPRIAYSIFIQLKNKLKWNNLTVLQTLVASSIDVLVNVPKLYRQRNPLNKSQFREFEKLPPAEIYWFPEKQNG